MASSNGRPTICKPSGQPVGRESARQRQHRQTQAVERSREPRESSHPADDLLHRPRGHRRQLGSRLGNGGRQDRIDLAEHLVHELARQARAQAPGLQIVVGGDVQADLQAGAHRRAQLVRPLAQHARVDDGALGARQHVAHVHDAGRIGQAQRHTRAPRDSQRARCRFHRRLHLGGHAVEVVVLRQRQSQSAQRPRRARRGPRAPGVGCWWRRADRGRRSART